MNNIEWSQETPIFDSSCFETDAKLNETVRDTTTSPDLMMEDIESELRKTKGFLKNSEIDITTSGQEELHHNIVKSENIE
jgi:hypothetical protein